jgi:hypothetical protein
MGVWKLKAKQPLGKAVFLVVPPTECEQRPLMGVWKLKAKQPLGKAVFLVVPPTELESVTFCSASKRSVQLSYEGLFI